MMTSATRVCVLLLLLSCSSDDDDVCKPDDADGVVGVDITLVVKVDDASFQPAIVKTQNSSHVTLTLTNTGTKSHGFAVDCLPTPNGRGCPDRSCFPAEATIAPIAPGASTTVKFTSPVVEGIYIYRSTAEGDAATGQFILQ
jgi:hypothetical protein